MTGNEELLYTKDHLWIKCDGDICTIGFTDSATDEFETILFVELPAIGAKVDEGDDIGSVESIKTVYPIISPVRGEVISVNDILFDNGQIMCGSPYDEGWMVRIRTFSGIDRDKLLSREEYDRLL